MKQDSPVQIATQPRLHMELRARVRICDEIISIKSDVCTYIIHAMYKEYAMDVHRALVLRIPRLQQIDRIRRLHCRKRLLERDCGS
jgi:hypothetical protein